MNFAKDPIVRVYVQDWARDTFRFTEDGSPIHVLDYYVQLETAKGHRFIRRARFAGGTADRHDGDREAAQRLCDSIHTQIAWRHTIDLQHWHEVDPVYGSEAYEALDATGYFRERDRYDDEFQAAGW